MRDPSMMGTFADIKTNWNRVEERGKCRDVSRGESYYYIISLLTR